MQLNGQNLVDVASVYPYYVSKGLSLDMLRLCNGQEFRFIDGYGKGYFLMTQTITSENVSFTVDSRTVSLKVIDRLSLEHPDHSGGLKIYVTAEPKYHLLDTIVQRNYNVTIDKSVPPYGTPTVVTYPPDQPTKTLKDVIEDILPSGVTLDYEADELRSYDISIEGMSVLRAIDHLCSIYGLIWTSTGSIVYVWDMQEAETSSDTGIPTLSDPINDIRYTELTNSPTNINVSFPVYNYARQVPKEYHTVEDDGTGQGQTINVMDPYYPAVINTLGTLRNESALDTRSAAIVTNLKAIKSSLDYVAKHHFEAQPLSQQPLSLSEVYGDWGRGPRSLYRSIHYPYIPARIPESKARYANNWRGVLTDGYVETVASFTVTPVVGLDGKIPPGPQRVYNIYRWPYGEEGWIVRVEWNPVDAQWEALQQEFECPPEELPPPPDVTSPEDPYEPPIGPDGEWEL